MGSNPEKIYVAGHAGLVGSAIVRQIEAVGKSSWIGATRSEFNLCDRQCSFSERDEIVRVVFISQRSLRNIV